MSRSWTLWVCPRCGTKEEVDVADLLEIGNPLCGYCLDRGTAVEMDRDE